MSRLPCRYCGLMVYNRLRHENHVHEVAQYPCSRCEREADTYTELVRHYHRRHEENIEDLRLIKPCYRPKPGQKKLTKRERDRVVKQKSGRPGPVTEKEATHEVESTVTHTSEKDADPKATGTTAPKEVVASTDKLKGWRIPKKPNTVVEVTDQKGRVMVEELDEPPPRTPGRPGTPEPEWFENPTYGDAATPPRGASTPPPPPVKRKIKLDRKGEANKKARRTLFPAGSHGGTKGSQYQEVQEDNVVILLDPEEEEEFSVRKKGLLPPQQQLLQALRKKCKKRLPETVIVQYDLLWRRRQKN